DCACAFDLLMRISEMKLTAPPQQWRSGSHFKGSDARPVNRQGKENIRITDCVMIEKIPNARAKVIRIHGPSAQWDRKPELIFLIALAAQRNEIKALANRQREQRSGDS